MKSTTTRTTDNKTKLQATAALIHSVNYWQPNWVSVYWKPPLPFQLSICILGLRNSPRSLDCVGFSLLGAGLRPPALHCSEGQDFKTEEQGLGAFHVQATQKCVPQESVFSSTA